MVQHPEVLWAQRSSESDEGKNILYLTVNLPDVKAPTLEYSLTTNAIHFKAKAGADEKEYAFDLELYRDVVPEKSKKTLSSRSLSLVIQKKDLEPEYWPRLTKEKIKNAFLKTDFSKWVDEDEQDEVAALPEEPDLGMGGGMPGLDGGMDFERMMAQMGGGLGGGGLGGGLGGEGPAGGLEENPLANTAEDESEDEGPPPLEEAEPAK